MAKMSEREFSFELVEKILDWIREQPEHGSVLVFLPGWNHIFALQKYLQQHPIYGKFYLKVISKKLVLYYCVQIIALLKVIVEFINAR